MRTIHVVHVGAATTMTLAVGRYNPDTLHRSFTTLIRSNYLPIPSIPRVTVRKITYIYSRYAGYYGQQITLHSGASENMRNVRLIHHSRMMLIQSWINVSIYPCIKFIHGGCNNCEPHLPLLRVENRANPIVSNALQPHKIRNDAGSVSLCFRQSGSHSSQNDDCGINCLA